MTHKANGSSEVTYDKNGSTLAVWVDGVMLTWTTSLKEAEAMALAVERRLERSSRAVNFNVLQKVAERAAEKMAIALN